MNHELAGQDRLRDNAIFRIGGVLAFLGVALVLASLASAPSFDLTWGIGLFCLAYLMILTAMYRVGVLMPTRGGIVTKHEDPWSYRFSFIILSVFGTGPICMVLMDEFVSKPHVLSLGTYIELFIMLMAGLAFILSLITVFGALIGGSFVGVCRALYKALTSHSTRTR